jgi:Flp pilus assembly protein TadD
VPALQMLQAVYPGDNAGAIGAMHHLYEEHPQDRAVLFALVDLQTANGETDQAEKTLSKVLATIKDQNGAGDTEVLRKLFGEYRRQGKTLEAAGRGE